MSFKRGDVGLEHANPVIETREVLMTYLALVILFRFPIFIYLSRKLFN